MGPNPSLTVQQGVVGATREDAIEACLQGGSPARADVALPGRQVSIEGVMYF